LAFWFEQGGGGIYNEDGTISITNSTVFGNSANQGGGIYNFVGTVTLTNNTVSGNSANQGGAIFNAPASALNIKNTIVANSPSGGNCAQAGTATSYGHNLASDGTCSSFFTSTGDLNSMPAGLDPSGLQNNGGPTATIALMPGSIAIDAVPLSNCREVDGVTSILTDQRGISRPQGTAATSEHMNRQPTLRPLSPASADRRTHLSLARLLPSAQISPTRTQRITHTCIIIGTTVLLTRTSMRPWSLQVPILAAVKLCTTMTPPASIP
jgi:hypothetical protein